VNEQAAARCDALSLHETILNLALINNDQFDFRHVSATTSTTTSTRDAGREASDHHRSCHGLAFCKWLICYYASDLSNDLDLADLERAFDAPP
jgi:hypothetical protein